MQRTAASAGEQKHRKGKTSVGNVENVMLTSDLSLTLSPKVGNESELGCANAARKCNSGEQ
jgi:hypothetical protein